MGANQKESFGRGKSKPAFLLNIETVIVAVTVVNFVGLVIPSIKQEDTFEGFRVRWSVKKHPHFLLYCIEVEHFYVAKRKEKYKVRDYWEVGIWEETKSIILGETWFGFQWRSKRAKLRGTESQSSRIIWRMINCNLGCSGEVTKGGVVFIIFAV